MDGSHIHVCGSAGPSCVYVHVCICVHMLQCLWSPLAFAIGGTYVAQWELQQVGLQWRNLLTTPIVDDHLSFLGISLMLVVDMIIYLLLAWYIEGVFPGRYGVAKPCYFPLQPSYWFSQRQYSCQAHLLDWCKSLWHSNQGDKLTLLQDEQESSSERCLCVSIRIYLCAID